MRVRRERAHDEAEAPFQPPIQGYYANQVSGEAAEAWKKDR